jgi:hypothetical protein
MLARILLSRDWKDRLCKAAMRWCVNLPCSHIIGLSREFFAFDITESRVELRLVREWDINVNVCRCRVRSYYLLKQCVCIKQMFDSRICMNVCLYPVILSFIVNLCENCNWSSWMLIHLLVWNALAVPQW